jgi:hypothetical protein
MILHNEVVIWGSIVSIVTRLQAGQLMSRDLIPSRGKRFLPSSNLPDYLWGPLVIMVGALTLGGKVSRV